MPQPDMTQVATEGQPVFPVETTENANSGESSPDKETKIDQTGSPEQNKQQAEKKDGDDTNFADHPRWTQRENDWKTRFNEQEKRHVEEITKLREEFLKTVPQRETTSEIPAWFGGDEQQWADYVKHQDALISKAKAQALEEIKSKTDAEQKKIDDATTYFNEQVELIEKDAVLNPTLEKVDRNKLLKTALDMELVDTQGRWNYRVAYQLMKSQFQPKKADTEEKKKIAGATTSEKTAETKKPAFLTNQDFKNPTNRPW